MKFIFTSLVKLYQFCISPLLPRSCRFTPTCSAYAIEAVDQHGVLAGSWLAVKRIVRCHPFAKDFKYDPVPAKKPEA